jgi:hypothetical protein
LEKVPYFFGSSEVSIQGLALARQVLYCLSYASSLNPSIWDKVICFILVMIRRQKYQEEERG